jgi:hypothetical protein
VDLVIVTKLFLLAVAPTALGIVLLKAPDWVAAAVRAWPRRRDDPVQPTGPPIERIAADLRRLLHLHGQLTTSAHLAMRAHRLWAVEAAIEVRAVEAARALDVPHREPHEPGGLGRTELHALLRALARAGLVLPTTTGPFTRHGRL